MRLLAMFKALPGAAAANCTPAASFPGGKPLPLVCKLVVQALRPDGTVDTGVPADTRTFTYDASGRVFTVKDAKDHVTTYGYHTSDSYPLADASFNSGDEVTVPMDARFQLGGNFTIEAWVYLTGTPGPGLAYAVASSTVDSSATGWRATIGSGNRVLNAFAGYGLTVASTKAPSEVIPLNAWTHVAWVRSGDQLYSFANGVLNSQGTITGGNVRGSGSPYLYIGRNAIPAAWWFNGRIDDLRITNGVARYTGNFTPPAAELPSRLHDPAGTGHMVGDLESVTNAAGHATQFTTYDLAGRVRQTIDPKGIVTDLEYTPRGLVNAVTVTAPGAAARTTTFSYDAIGQLTEALLPDGTTVSYSHDAAHRLVGITDARGNSVAYTLDGSGHRVGEEVRDPGGTLRRSITRSYDALNRLQQVTGASR